MYVAAWGYHRQGSCQAGFGADLAPGGNWTFIGAVGSWYWQGMSPNTTFSVLIHAGTPVWVTRLVWFGNSPRWKKKGWGSAPPAWSKFKSPSRWCLNYVSDIQPRGALLACRFFLPSFFVGSTWLDGRFEWNLVTSVFHPPSQFPFVVSVQTQEVKGRSIAFSRRDRRERLLPSFFYISIPIGSTTYDNGSYGFQSGGFLHASWRCWNHFIMAFIFQRCKN